MSNSSGALKITGLSIFLLILLASPVFFFDFRSSLDQPEVPQDLTQDQTYLRGVEDLDTEEMDEDPRIFYLPDHKEGFASWLNEEIELPGLELPNLEIPEADFYLEEDFPAPYNSLRVDLETKIRQDWPLPELQEEDLELELKQSKGALLVFKGKQAQEPLLDDELLTDLFKEIEDGQLSKPTILKVATSNGEMEVDLAQSCGVSSLDNTYAVHLLRVFYKEQILESLTKNSSMRMAEGSDFYIIEWRLAFKRLKSQ